MTNRICVPLEDMEVGMLYNIAVRTRPTNRRGFLRDQYLSRRPNSNRKGWLFVFDGETGGGFQLWSDEMVRVEEVP